MITRLFSNLRFKVGCIVLLCFIANSVFGQCLLVVPAGSGTSFWGEVQKGAIAAGKEYNFDIYFRGPDNELNTDGQEAVLNKFLNQLNCSGVVLAPNSKQRKEDVDRLNSRGIATVFIDRDAGAGADVVSLVATNNLMVGEKAADEMAQKIGAGGRVALLKLAPGVVTTTQREEAFRKRALELGLSIEVEHYVGASISHVKVEALMLEDKLKGVDGIFTPNEVTTVGVQSALDFLGTSKILHIGVDTSKYIESYIAQGRIFGVVVQDPYAMGYLGVETMVKHLNGERVESYYSVPIRFLGQSGFDAS